ncbi:hypothetical protein EB796_010139 [Bugula neritina]|uniref:Uncharacterized protein n=1 Tax=Bugula neritina TaxID=10212 RepID=A0A7J7K035_BUGNE|nr:hypothetical protein EB796_016439 [Bugula neritina]KAF6031553.1 hypothetical protein EB796_010139 [Bugula neritina]
MSFTILTGAVTRPTRASTSIMVTIPKATSGNPINRTTVTSVTATISSLLRRTYCPDFLFDVRYRPSFT